MSIKPIYFSILLALSGVFICGTTIAQGQHPNYLQALSDLKAARSALMQHIDEQSMTHNEKEALRQINLVIREINDASIDGGKESDEQPQVQEGLNNAVQLQQCIKLLRKAEYDLRHEEDSQFANGLRDRSIKNCDEAIKFAVQQRTSEQNKKN